MAYIIGIVLALSVAFFAKRVGLDRDRAFYPTVLIVVGSYYVLFAAMGASTPVLVVESLVMIGFAALAVMGFTSSPWILVVALASHGVFDLLHGALIENAGVPSWWPAFCMAYDVAAAACVAAITVQRNRLGVTPA